MKGTITISFGKYGGFYITKGFCFRICFGWVAVTYWPFDIDYKIEEWLTDDT